MDPQSGENKGGSRPPKALDWIEENPEDIREADVIVGIPSYNEADSIPFVAEQAAIGLKTYFKDCRCVLINCDNFSRDRTREAFLAVDTGIPKIYLSTPEGVQGKGNNFRNLFQKSCDLVARAIIVVDADLRSITPRWIKLLGEPLLQGYGFLAPIYLRHKNEGVITRHIAYPFSRAMYGRRILNPIGGDFGFSGELAGIYLESELWDDYVASFGIDIWMTTLAVNSGFPVAQAFLGAPKIHRTKDPVASLGPMFEHVVSTIFRLMGCFEDSWKEVLWSKPTPIFGFGSGETDKPPPVQVNEDLLCEEFTEGFKAHEPLCKRVLCEDVFRSVREIAGRSRDQIELPADLWAKIVYDFAVGFYRNGIPRDTLVDALVPLLSGRVGSYARITRGMQVQAVEAYLEEQCNIFEEAKPYLLEQWDAVKKIREDHIRGEPDAENTARR